VPFTQPVACDAPVTVDVDASVSVRVPVLSRPFVNDRGPFSVRFVTSDTPDRLLMSKIAFDVLENVPWRSIDCGALPASENSGVPEAGLNASDAPGFTWMSPWITVPPVMFRLNVPWLTASVSITAPPPPVTACVPATLYSKSAYVRPENDGVTAPS